MAVSGAAADVGNAEVAGVDEADELRVLVIEDRVRADRVGAGPPHVRVARFWGGGAIACRPGGRILLVAVAAVAVDAAEVDGGLDVHVADALVAGGAGLALGI